MIVVTTPTDTSFSFICDWEYKHKPNSSTSNNDAAEHFAVFFMTLDKSVFGHTKFIIKDPELFNSANSTVQVIELGVNESQYNNFDMIEVCQDVIYFYTDCNYPDSEACSNGCDQCWRCTSSFVITYCWMENIEPGGGGGGSGGSGGGGSGGGSTTPPDCDNTHDGSSGRDNLIVDCAEPGWEPEPINEVPYEDPCITANSIAKSIDTLYALGKIDSVIQTIPNLSTEPMEKGFPVYRKFKINPFNSNDTTFTNSYKPGNVQTGDSNQITITANIPYLHIWATMAHTHPSSGYSAPSANDLYSLIDQKNQENHFEASFIIAANGNTYAIAISDISKATSFFSTKSLFLNTQSNGWKENSEIGKEFLKSSTYFVKLFKGDPDQLNKSYENAYSSVLSKFNSGIILFKKNQSGNFKPLIIKSMQDPHKPKKIIYTTECL